MATNPRKETEAPGLLAAYMARIGKGGLLSRRQEVGLGRKAQSGDSEDRRRFVERNLQLGVSRESGGQGLPLKVLIQEGNMGLMKAKFF